MPQLPRGVQRKKRIASAKPTAPQAATNAKSPQANPDPTVAEWGRMLVKAQSRLETDPQLALWPGVCIAVTALGFTLLGEAMREALDPKFRR